MRPRWKPEALGLVELALGEALGKGMLKQGLLSEADEGAGRQLDRSDPRRYPVPQLDQAPKRWSGALEKLVEVHPKIGYAEKLRDHRSFISKAMTSLATFAARLCSSRRNLAKLGKPVDREEWIMTPQMVNAYYNPSMNEIVFPAAILQLLFFDMNADDAFNYGAIVLSSAMNGYGFDHQGLKFMGDGKINNWWTEADRKEFESRAKETDPQVQLVEPKQLPGQKVNGALTIGENIGDLGGLAIAYRAYRRSLGDHQPPVLGGSPAMKCFFIGYGFAPGRHEVSRRGAARRLATDPHSPAEFRCNGVVRNIPEFYSAFGVKEGESSIGRRNSGANLVGLRNRGRLLSSSGEAD